MLQREITLCELRLLRVLMEAAPDCRLGEQAADRLFVEPLDDGGMGSFRLVGERDRENRACAEVEFADKDGVLVLATLYVDSENRPVEVGIWKVNFDPLDEIPTELPLAKPFTFWSREGRG